MALEKDMRGERYIHEIYLSRAVAQGDRTCERLTIDYPFINRHEAIIHQAAVCLKPLLATLEIRWRQKQQSSSSENMTQPFEHLENTVSMKQ